MNRLKGKIAVITGASSGIGKACAEQLAAMGVDLVLLARRKDRIEQLASRLQRECSIKAYAFPLDVTQPDHVKQVSEEIYRVIGREVDILVNNAGLGLGLAPFSEGLESDWSLMIDTNIKGVLSVTKAFMPSFQKGKGDIVNISSLAGRVMYARGNIYAMTKFAMKAFSRALKLELLDTDVRVIDIAPGQTETEFSLVRFKGDAEKAKQVYEKFTPLSADDIASAVVYALNCPPHMMVADMVITATRQSLQLTS